MNVILKTDPRYAAAQKAIDAMQDYFDLLKCNYPLDMRAVRWIEDNFGRVIIFTRGEYKNVIMQAVGEYMGDSHHFEISQMEPIGPDENIVVVG